MKKFIIVYTTTKNKKEAEKIAETLVKEKMVACVNVFKIDSIYSWQGKIEKNREYAMFLKTKKGLFEKIKKRIKKIHSYSLPCLISFSIEKGDKDYLKWVEKSTL